MKRKSPKFLWIFLSAALLTLCIVLVSLFLDLTVFRSPAVLTAEDLRLLNRTYVQPVDIVDVRRRIWHAAIKETTGSPCTRAAVGETLSFSVANGRIEPFRVDAKLVYSDDRVSLWVPNDLLPMGNKFILSIAEYEKASMSVLQPLNYSQTISPIIGNTAVLLTHGLGRGVAGYYTPLNEYPKELASGSNECGMVFMNADEPGIDGALGVYTLSHELGHRFLWLSDPNEFLWVNEGLADLFSLRVGQYNRNDVETFRSDTNINWTGLDADRFGSGSAGAALSFFAYLRSVYGEEFLVNLTKVPSNGFIGIEDNLRMKAHYEDVLLGWAEYLWTHAVSGNSGDSADSFWSRPAITKSISCDEKADGTAFQHGIVYVGLNCPSDLLLTFRGNDNIQAFPVYKNRPFVMWSNRGNLIDTSMTKQFDFTSHPGKLTLTYQVRYNNSSSDHLYPLFSYDNINWQSLNRLQGEDGNVGLWGQNMDGWTSETVDISSLAGKKVWIRFEYVSGVASVASGFYISDVSIKEVNYTSDYKDGLDGWSTNGFVRVPGLLPQVYRAAIIQRAPGGDYVVRQIEVEQGNAFSTKVISPPGTETILVLMAMTPYTDLPAEYSLTLETR